MSCIIEHPTVIGTSDPTKSKKVRIRLSVELDVTVPADWDTNDVDFYFNESSHCLTDEIDQLHREVDEAQLGTCVICERATVEVLPEAKSQKLQAGVA